MQINRLTARKVETLRTGFHSDGQGLYLRVREGGSKSWVFRYTRAGRTKEIGLGVSHTLSLKDARRVSHEMRSFSLVTSAYFFLPFKMAL